MIVQRCEEFAPEFACELIETKPNYVNIHDHGLLTALFSFIVFFFAPSSIRMFISLVVGVRCCADNLL